MFIGLDDKAGQRIARLLILDLEKRRHQEAGHDFDEIQYISGVGGQPVQDNVLDLFFGNGNAEPTGQVQTNVTG
jgi:hypothetical protein